MASGDAVFVGSIPAMYDQHLRHLMFQPYADDIAVRLADMTDGTLLETAAGTGIVTATLAARLPAAVTIIATDLNQPMLDHAKSKPGMDRVRFQQADAQGLPFDDQSCDVVVCQFGAMFFANRVLGFQEAYRVLKPGGRLLFNVWDSRAVNPVMDATLVGLERRYPAHPSWFLERTPMGYRDPAVIRADLHAAGFPDCRIETVIKTGHSLSPRGPAEGFCQGSPMRAEIEGLDPPGLAAATDASAAAVAERFGDGPFEATMQALVIEAKRP